MTNWRALVLRHLLGRLHIGSEVIRHLSTFQRLGETLESAPPLEMLPVGARTALRAVRTRAAAQIRPDWLWPRWLERQLDPADPAFTPRGHLPLLQNVTGRNWTMIGNAASAWEAIIDPTGLVTPFFDAWSLDWWVQSGGRWHLPSREPVRQRLAGCLPLVTTELPLPGGPVVQRVYGAEDGHELVVVEIANQSPLPRHAALAARPYNPEGLAVVEHVRVSAGVVYVDGREGVVVDGAPLGVALGSFKLGDSLHHATAGRWLRPDAATVDDPAGLAQAAVLVDLPPGATVRAAMPMTARTGLRRSRPGRGAGNVTAVASLPDAEAVASGWRRRLERGLRVELPDARLQQAVDANRGYLLLLHDPGDITAGPYTYHRFWFRDAAYQVAALSRWGFTDEAADVLRSYPGRQREDGFFYSQWREWDANGAAIWAIAEHHRLTGDRRLLEEMTPAVLRGAEWIVRMCAARRGKPDARGLLPAGISAEHLGPFDFYYWDDLWAWRGLLDAAAVASWSGDPRGARFEDAATALRRALFASLQRASARLGCQAIPAGPTRGVDAGMIGSLAGCYPLRLLAADDPWIQGTAEVIREQLCIGDAFYQGISHTGFGTYLTLQLAFVEQQAGDPRGWRRLQWLLDAATATFTWPEAIHPQLPGGCMGDGHHGWMVADLLNFVRMTLLCDAQDHVALLPFLPPDWQGKPVSVHSAPSHHGVVSYELQWRGQQPLLRWEWTSGGGRLRAPGLDPAWTTTARRGEAVLASR